MRLSEIHIYPIKALGGIALRDARLTPFGLENDRRFMLVDSTGCFVSQRALPMLTQFGTAISGATLTVFLKKNPAEKIEIPLRPTPSANRIEATIWNSVCPAEVQNDNVNHWFSTILNENLRLVYMPDDSLRPTNPDYAPGHRVSFADGYPMLLLGQSTLDELNRRLAQPLPMNRFRPNFVFTGSQPHAEDTFREFFIGEGHFLGVKPCARCEVPTTDQDTGERAAEPLKTLATYRLQGKNILFGENVVWLGSGDMVRTGDLIRVVSRK